MERKAVPELLPKIHDRIWLIEQIWEDFDGYRDSENNYIRRILC